VTIGRNSVIGAGSVVVKDIPPDTIAAGNPAKPVKTIDTDRKHVTREDLLSNPKAFYDYALTLEKEFLGKNTTLRWLRFLLFPKRDD
jgi:carbonic anhydrase/acetyltransferase-like protein (isoleucine patch superfamily)